VNSVACEWDDRHFSTVMSKDKAQAGTPTPWLKRNASVDFLGEPVDRAPRSLSAGPDLQRRIVELQQEYSGEG